MFELYWYQLKCGVIFNEKNKHTKYEKALNYVSKCYMRLRKSLYFFICKF